MSIPSVPVVAADKPRRNFLRRLSAKFSQRRLLNKKKSTMDESTTSDATPPSASVTTHSSSVVSDMTNSAPSTPARSVDTTTTTKQVVAVDKAILLKMPETPLTTQEQAPKQDFSKILDKIVVPTSINNASALLVLSGMALVVLAAFAVLFWINKEQAIMMDPPPVEHVGLGGFVKNLLQKK